MRMECLTHFVYFLGMMKRWLIFIEIEYSYSSVQNERYHCHNSSFFGSGSTHELVLERWFPCDLVKQALKYVEITHLPFCNNYSAKYLDITNCPNSDIKWRNAWKKGVATSDDVLRFICHIQLIVSPIFWFFDTKEKRIDSYHPFFIFVQHF